MAVIGWLAVVIVGVVIIGGLVVALAALPDYNRYRRLRKM